MASKPIGSVYGIHANMTGVQYIDGTVNVSIYSSTMDPMAECYSASIWAKKRDPTANSLEWCLDYRELSPNDRAIQVSELLPRSMLLRFFWQRPRRVSSAPNVVDFYRYWSCSLAVGCARHAIWWKAPQQKMDLTIRVEDLQSNIWRFTVI